RNLDRGGAGRARGALRHERRTVQAPQPAQNRHYQPRRCRAGRRALWPAVRQDHRRANSSRWRRPAGDLTGGEPRRGISVCEGFEETTRMLNMAADLLVALHFAFILFVVLGGMLVLRWPWLAW